MNPYVADGTQDPGLEELTQKSLNFVTTDELVEKEIPYQYALTLTREKD